MANFLRGEIEADIGGARRTLCLTLGALAELETAFGAGDVIALAERFERGGLSARDLQIIIACGLRGAGASVSNEEVAAMRIEGGLNAYVQIAADLVAATFAGSSGEPRPPAPQDA
ncbi:MAG: gene transfer agent family protein [Rhodoblastus sp.]